LPFLGEIFQTQTQIIDGLPDLTQPEPQKIDPTKIKNFDPDPSLVSMAQWSLHRLFTMSIWVRFMDPDLDMTPRRTIHQEDDHLLKKSFLYTFWTLKKQFNCNT